MTVRVNVPLKDVGKIERRIKQTWRQEMGKAMRRAANMCRLVLITKTAKAPPAKPDATSPIGAIDQRGVIDGWEFLFTPGELSVMIFNKAPHAGFVEQGVKTSSGKIGGLIARDLIASWMIRKGINITQKKGDKFVPVNAKKAAAFIIFKINSRKGTWRFRPRNIAKDSARRVKEIFNREIKEQFDRMTLKAINEAGKTR